MGIYANRILPRIIDLTMRRNEFSVIRARVAVGLSGRVLEVGFGSGLNVPHYPPAVTEVLAVDPSITGRRLSAKRVAASAVQIHSIALDGQAIPLGDGSIDHVLTTWTMCTIPDVDRALSEIHRVLRPGGSLHFAEHGRSPDAAVARRQDRLTPIQRRIAGGCHLNRPIDQIIARSGLRLTTLATSYLPGPRAVGYLYEGIATKH